MKKHRVSELPAAPKHHIFEEMIGGTEIYVGDFGLSRPGGRSHSDDPTGPIHTHEDCELFMFLQGSGQVEIDGVMHDAVAGDIFVAEPGEDHHIISSVNEPFFVLWCHAR